ncbi:MAG TPA: GNAT family N-acetyltransferase [Phycisphaerales bacterium]|nr:GNAT family N-acetyltransferase [Phycisphaerales bacterium]
MASLINQAGAVGGGGQPSPFRVMRADGELARAAMARLMAGAGEAGPGGRGEAARDQGVGLLDDLAQDQGGRLWVAQLEDGSVGEVAQVVPSSGRTAGIYLAPGSRPTRGVQQQRVAVIAAACAALSRGEYGETVLAQGLLEPGETDAAAAYLDAGFERLAELAYLRRDISRFARYDRPEWGGRGGAEGVGVRVTRMSELPWDTGQSLLAQAMEESYAGTLDCPALCGMRTVEDVLASHKSVGAFDPSLWWLVSAGGRPAGCMLLSRFPAHDTVELVYLGVGPALRGRGVGAGLIALALAELQALGEKSLACAVDLNNAPALALYKRAKFKEFARRTALIRDLRGAGGRPA